MSGIPAVARLAAKEGARNAFFFLLLLALAGWISLLPLLLNFTFSSAETMVRDAALSLLLMAGLAEAVREGAAGTARERESARTEELFASGLGPFAWLSGRWLGGLAATARLLLAGGAATALAVAAARGGLTVRKAPVLFALSAWILSLAVSAFRAKRLREPFPAIAVRWLVAFFLLSACAAWAFRPAEGTEIVRALAPAFFLLFCACAAARALALFWGAVARSTAAATATVLFLAGGMISESFLASRLAHPAAKLLYAVVPNLQAFFLLDALAEGTPIPFAYLAGAAAYAAAFSAGWLLLASAVLRLREGGSA